MNEPIYIIDGARTPFLKSRNRPGPFAASDLATAASNPYVLMVSEYVKTHLACEAVVISAQIESELIDLAPDEADAFLKELGVAESGVGSLIRATYHLLGLLTFFTAGENETRAWPLRRAAPAPPAPRGLRSSAALT